MKKYKKLLILGLSLTLSLFLFTACSSSSKDSAVSPNFNSSSDGTGSTEFPNMMEESADAESGSALEPEKMIVHIYLDYETVEFEKSTKSLSDVITKYKAYVENSSVSYNTHYNNRSYRTASYTIRVPKNSVTSFKNELIGLGNMLSENISKEDASKYYWDTSSRLKIVTSKEERLLELLEQAKNMEDILAIENQLTDTVYEKENLQGTLNNIDDQVDYSTFYLNIKEVDRLSNAETVETTFGERLVNAISDSASVFLISMQNLTISLIYILPFLLVIALIGYPIHRIFKKSNRLPNGRPKLFKRKKKDL